MASPAPPQIEPRKQPVQSRSTATVEALYEASIQVLLELGYRKFTTTRVAERAEQGKQAGDLRALAAVVEERTKPGAAFALTSKQKAAVATGAITLLGALIDGARHLVVWAIAAVKSGALTR